MTGVEIAAGMIREGAVRNHALATASRRTGEDYWRIAVALARRSGVRVRREAEERRDERRTA